MSKLLVASLAVSVSLLAVACGAPPPPTMPEASLPAAPAEPALTPPSAPGLPPGPAMPQPAMPTAPAPPGLPK
jgi:hypothetical protein